MAKKYIGCVERVRIELTPRRLGMVVMCSIKTDVQNRPAERRLDPRQVDAILPVSVLIGSKTGKGEASVQILDVMIPILARMIEGRMVRWDPDSQDCSLVGWSGIKFSVTEGGF